MVASVALCNEGPGRNIDTHADNYVFLFFFFFFWRVLSMRIFTWNKACLNGQKDYEYPCGQIALSSKGRKNSRNFHVFSNILIASSPSKTPSLRCIQLEVDS